MNRPIKTGFLFMIIMILCQGFKGLERKQEGRKECNIDLHEFSINNKGSKSVNPLLKAYDVKFYKLDIAANDQSGYMSANTTILSEMVDDQVDKLVFELSSSLIVDSILISGVLLNKFNHLEDEITLTLNTPLGAGELIEVQVFYHGTPTMGMGNVMDTDWNIPLTGTSSQPYRSKGWFVCKQDLEDKADSVWVFITTDDHLTGVSNGLLTRTVSLPNSKVRYEWKSTYPIAYYLISFAIADYIEYNIEANPAGCPNPILIQNFLYDVPGCLEYYQWEIDATIEIMELFCELFGPYPFRDEKYGHYIWPLRSNGMEHQTMTGVGNFSFGMIAHELAHSWFGNYVTCGTWQDIWINEGFATYSAYLAREYLRPPFAPENLSTRFEDALSEPEGSVYIPEEEADIPSRIFNSNLSYAKGMTLLHMIRFELDDDELFFQILRDYINLYANSVATGLDFRSVLEDKSGIDFTSFFDQWYFGSGYPIFSVSWEQQDQTVTLNVSQTTSSSTTPLFITPMEYKLVYQGGDSIVRVNHTKNNETYQFIIPFEIESLVVDPNEWVLNKVGTIEHVHIEKREINLFSVYPNPAHECFYFTTATQLEGKLLVEIYNSLNQLVYIKDFYQCQSQDRYRIELNQLPDGIYYAKFTSGTYHELKKIVID